MAASAPAVFDAFNEDSECYQRVRHSDEVDWKMAKNEVENVKAELLPLMPAERVEKIQRDIFSKLVNGTTMEDNFQAHVRRITNIEI